MIYPNLKMAIDYCGRKLKNTGQYHRSEKWQGIDTLANNIPEMWETMNVSFTAAVGNLTEPNIVSINPNRPWADIHFKERISGKPLNPGESYKIWPYYGRDKQMRENEKFTHTYMERFWPKDASELKLTEKLVGIRYDYGDLDDVINLLAKEPGTRQAFLPIWFPEDTGVSHGGRVPCSLGYLFNIRNHTLHMTYYLRSCDFIRHFRDDVYLAVKLMYHVKQELAIKSNYEIYPNVGTLTMHIASLHIFAQELPLLNKYE